MMRAFIILFTYNFMYLLLDINLNKQDAWDVLHTCDLALYTVF